MDDVVYFNFSKKIDNNNYANVVKLMNSLDKTKLKMQTEISWYEFFNKYFESNTNFYETIVELPCSYCKAMVSTSLINLLKRINSSMFGYENVNCHNKSCKSDHRRYVISVQTLLGKTSAQGHVVSEDQKIKWRATVNATGIMQELGKAKRGKTIEEIYGEDMGKATRKKLIKWRATLSKEPHQGCKHSDASKEKMSNSAIEKFKKDPNLIKQIAKKNSIIYHSKSDEEKKQFAANVIKSIESKYNFLSHKDWGYHKAWWQKDGDKDQSFQSMYEKDYYTILDKSKILYKKNSSIYIPYIHPKDNKKHLFVPDVLIYSEHFGKITSIHEVKPYEFAFNPRKRESIYYKITEAKLKSLEEYCKINDYGLSIITEKEIYGIEDKIYKKAMRGYSNKSILPEC